MFIFLLYNIVKLGIYQNHSEPDHSIPCCYTLGQDNLDSLLRHFLVYSQGNRKPHALRSGWCCWSAVMGRRRAPGGGSLGRVLIRHQTQRSRSHRHADSWVRKSALSISFPSRSESLHTTKVGPGLAPEQDFKADPSQDAGRRES